MDNSKHTEHDKNSCIISHTQNTTALQINLFLKWTLSYWLQTNGLSAFTNAKTSKVSRKTPQSASVRVTDRQGELLYSWRDVASHDRDKIKQCFGSQ
jgi:hypothetical protein